MNPSQEPKYKIENGKIHNRQSGEQIPDYEPLFILRGRDKHAASAILSYLAAVESAKKDGHPSSNAPHIRAVEMRLAQFKRFAIDHPERMKEPDTIITGDWYP